jgi:hypothetical protein
MSEQAPRTIKLQGTQPPISTVGNSDSFPLGEAPEAGVLSSASYVPETTITGANTNTRIHRVVNKGQAGSGTTVMASLQYNSGVNATAGDEKALTLSGTAADLVVAAGDIIAFESNAVATGIADPGGLVQVELSRY